MLKQDSRGVVDYFLYPRKKDIQKGVTIFAGVLVGISLNGKMPDIGNCAMAWIIVEFFMYQARYQINDIRGIEEDKNACRSDRLPVERFSSYREAIYVSIGIAFVRVASAVLLALNLPNELSGHFLRIIGVLGILTLAYEGMRESGAFGKCKVPIVLFLVSLGYPVRFVAGILVAYPSFFQLRIELIVSLCVSIAGMGLFSAVLPWIDQVIQEKQGGKGFTKKYIFEYLYDLIKNRYESIQLPDHKRECLHLVGRINDPWNIGYVFAMMGLTLSLHFYNKPLNEVFVILDLVVFVCVVCNYSYEYKKAIKNYIVTAVGVFLKITMLHFTSFASDFNYIICIYQVVIIVMYALLKYQIRYDYDFAGMYKENLSSLLSILVGKQTAKLLNDEENKEDSPKT